jgi:hypothetical protein
MLSTAAASLSFMKFPSRPFSACVPDAAPHNIIVPVMRHGEHGVEALSQFETRTPVALTAQFNCNHTKRQTA